MIKISLFFVKSFKSTIISSYFKNMISYNSNGSWTFRIFYPRMQAYQFNFVWQSFCLIRSLRWSVQLFISKVKIVELKILPFRRRNRLGKDIVIDLEVNKYCTAHRRIHTKCQLELIGLNIYHPTAVFFVCLFVTT